MNKEIFHGKWEETKGFLKQKWGKLTDDDLIQIEGSHESIFGILERYYGYAKDKVQEVLDEMFKK
ncbi:MAG TPA: CsbD family protein [Burkholderiales bacterium]|nr:CsbD family protein [Burkholderiales bacterium]